MHTLHAKPVLSDPYSVFQFPIPIIVFFLIFALDITVLYIVY